MQIATVGHSNRTLEQFVAILDAHRIGLVADVRIHPRSRYLPHFNGGALGEALSSHGIGYIHFRDLGGYRKPRPDSRNTAFPENSFRGYADYMETEAFAQALSKLIALTVETRLAVMCAEADPLGCHRSLIADMLLTRGARVEHIVSLGVAEPHRLRPEGRVINGHLTYTGRQLSFIENEE